MGWVYKVGVVISVGISVWAGCMDWCMGWV